MDSNRRALSWRCQPLCLRNGWLDQISRLDHHWHKPDYHSIDHHGRVMEYIHAYLECDEIGLPSLMQTQLHPVYISQECRRYSIPCTWKLLSRRVKTEHGSLWMYLSAIREDIAVYFTALHITSLEHGSLYFTSLQELDRSFK